LYFFKLGSLALIGAYMQYPFPIIAAMDKQSVYLLNLTAIENGVKSFSVSGKQIN